MKYRIHYACVNDIGRVRSMNQDNYICVGRYLHTPDESVEYPLRGTVSADRLLFGIFDGMGGEEHGEAASMIAAETASMVFPGDNPAADLLDCCMRANTSICEYAKEQGIRSTGTTAAMLAFTRDAITLCNIGDSRIFHFSDGILKQISVDHVVPMSGRKKPPLSQSLGIPESEFIIQPYIAMGQYHVGDMFMICSDGITDMVTEKEISEILGEYETEQAASLLVNRALENGGRDNITVILCRIEKEKNILSRLFSVK